MEYQEKEEITETTLVEKRPSPPPSFWMNFIALAILFGMIVTAHQLSLRYENTQLPPESPETQIIMEDLESEKPIAESNAVTIPSTDGPEAKPTEPAPRIAPKPIVQPVSLPKTQKRIVKKKPKTAPKPYTEPDPFTSGGSEDLDNKLSQMEYRKGNIVRIPTVKKNREAAADKPLPETDAEEKFIPFETKEETRQL